MNPFFTAYQLPLPGTQELATAVVSTAKFLAAGSQPAKVELTGKQVFSARKLASLHAHRAQVLAQRRTTIPTSAKRW